MHFGHSTVSQTAGMPMRRKYYLCLQMLTHRNTSLEANVRLTPLSASLETELSSILPCVQSITRNSIL